MARSSSEDIRCALDSRGCSCISPVGKGGRVDASLLDGCVGSSGSAENRLTTGIVGGSV